MYDDYVSLKYWKKSDPSSTAIAHKYDCGYHKSTSAIAQKCRTAMRLGP